MNDIVTSLSDTFYNRFSKQTLNLFSENGWDKRYGGLFEVLGPNGESRDIEFRRIMVHARQLFVFSRWSKLTGNTSFVANADAIFDFMVNAFWDKKNGGWFSKINLDGSPRDKNKNLYAHAFVLFGLANYKYALNRENVQVWIDKTLTIIEDKFSREDRSFSEELNSDFEDLSIDTRKQNPHMHLLEAALYLLEKDKQNQRYAILVDRLLKLFETKFLDYEGSIVREYLDHNFRPSLVNSSVVEPGHHFEWAWLLHWSGKTLVNECYNYKPLSQKLLTSACNLGWDRDYGGVFDEVDCTNNAPLLASKRLWPLLELIKALCVSPAIPCSVSLTTALTLLLKRYIAPDGFWVERYQKNWSEPDNNMPTSSVYHLAMAVLELEQLKLKSV